MTDGDAESRNLAWQVVSGHRKIGEPPSWGSISSFAVSFRICVKPFVRSLKESGQGAVDMIAEAAEGSTAGSSVSG
jgi:hypothetical protein